MAFFENLIGRLESAQKEMLRDRHPYLTRKTKGLGYQWIQKQGGNGCRPVKAQASISMEKSPPPLPGAPPPPKQAAAPTPAPTRTPAPKTGASIKTLAPAETPAKTPEVDCPQPPPFDMLDLPEGMRAMGFKYAASCAERWFNGKANVIPDKSKDVVADEFVSADALKLDWVLSFGNVKARYQHMLDETKAREIENVFNAQAKQQLIANFESFLAKRNHFYSGTLEALTESGGDMQQLHQRFQFQQCYVSAADVSGGYLNLGANLVTGSAVMNDLTAALANFYFYAAIARAEITTQQYMRYDTPQTCRRCLQSTVTLTHLYVYVKDVYSFNDSAVGSTSQDLGHWNRQGVIVAADAFLVETGSKLKPKYGFEVGNETREYLPPVPTHLDRPVDTGNSLKKSEVFYPVRNRDFNQWRDLKQRGGDFFIFSNRELVKLKNPIVIKLNEFCGANKNEVQKSH